MTLAEADLTALGVPLRCPLLWATALDAPTGLGGPSASRGRVRALDEAELLARADLPVAPGRGARLLDPTGAGVAVLADAWGKEPAALARRWGLRDSDLRALVPDLPHRLDCYRLLCALALEHPGTPTLVDWRCPWTRQHLRSSGRTPAGRTCCSPTAAPSRTGPTGASSPRWSRCSGTGCRSRRCSSRRPTPGGPQAGAA